MRFLWPRPFTRRRLLALVFATVLGLTVFSLRIGFGDRHGNSNAPLAVEDSPEPLSSSGAVIEDPPPRPCSSPWPADVVESLAPGDQATIGSAFVKIPARTFRGDEKKPKPNLLLTFVWSGFDTSPGGINDLFLRSFRRAQETEADIVVLYHGFPLSQEIKAVAKELDVNFVPVPPSLHNHGAFLSNDLVVFRFTAWWWYLEQNKDRYGFVAHADTDVVFQRDPFSPGCGPAVEGLHLYEETLDILLKEESMHQGWIERCPYIMGKTGREVWASLPNDRGRICAGYAQGDAASMLSYLRIMSQETDRLGPCNDQGLLNALVWGSKMMPASLPIIVFPAFAGPVKTLDVGYYRDKHGLAYSNRGYQYCVLHQYKEDRAPGFAAMWRRIVETPKGDPLPIAPRFCPSSSDASCPGSLRSLGDRGGNMSVPVDDLPSPSSASSVFYTAMPDNRFGTGVHAKAVSRMVNSKRMTVPPLPAPAVLHESSDPDEDNVWGAAMMKGVVLPPCLS